MKTGRRWVWLVACASAGTAVGGLGHWWTGDEAWYAAITVAIALGWFAVADPAKCDRSRR